jgi:hypothetical protein
MSRAKKQKFAVDTAPLSSGIPMSTDQAETQAQAAAREAVAANSTEVVEFQPQLITAYQQSALYAWKGFPRYNPDILVGRKGLKVYEDMMSDEQIKAVMNFRRDAVTARGWDVVFPASSSLDEAEQERRINMLKFLLQAMDGSITDGLNSILRAMQFGYSITEKVFDFIDYEGKSQYYCAALQAKPLQTFYFECDPYGRIVEFYQLLGGLRNELDLKKFVYYVHNPDEDNIFGRSELRSAYRSWYAKDVIIRLWNLWMERMAGGFLAVTRTPDSAPVVPGTQEYLDLTRALSSITTTTSMLLPTGFDAKLITPGNTDQYQAALSWHDRAIAKSQLVPNLLGVSDQGDHGSLAQSASQLEAFAWTLANISNRLADCVNDQLIWDICEQNFGDGDYPEFVFSAVSDAQLQWMITSWKDLVGAKSVHVTPKDEQHIRAILDFPDITPEEITQMDQKAQQDAITLIQAKPAPQMNGKGNGNFKRKFYQAWLDENSGVREFLNQRFADLRIEGERLHGSAHWQQLNKVEPGSEEWNDNAWNAIVETYSQRRDTLAYSALHTLVEKSVGALQ